MVVIRRGYPLRGVCVEKGEKAVRTSKEDHFSSLNHIDCTNRILSKVHHT